MLLVLYMKKIKRIKKNQIFLLLLQGMHPEVLFSEVFLADKEIEAIGLLGRDLNEEHLLLITITEFREHPFILY